MSMTTAQRRARRTVLSSTLAGAVVVGGALASAAPAVAGKPGAGHCARVDKVRVKGAERVEVACLDDLTTTGTTRSGHTNPADWSGLHAPGTRTPSGVPGIQVDGYFPDTSTSNTNHGWNHDSQFVIRIPDDWNGGLVVSGAPGVRGQYANDLVIGDWVLAKGYAFASTDKGNMGAGFWDDGSTPGGSIREWHRRVTELAVAARDTVGHVRAQRPSRTYMAGISNGGYLTRWQLENRPDLYDGGLDWEGTLFRADGPNLLTYLPTALEHYPAYAATGDEAAHAAMLDAGFQPGTEFLWPFHHQVYWDATQRWYREELDPTYDGDLKAGVPFCASGTPACDADYDYAARPQAVKDAVRSIELTGAIGKPLVTIHGDLDTLLPIATDSDVYDRLVDDAGSGDRHRYYRVEDGTHTDGLYAAFPDRLRPLLPCARTGFDLLTAWVEDGTPPPADRTVPRPAGDVLDTCAL
ncbi:3-hydroxybutyrate oligomer hydrolase family protein [Oryzobacter terrae]|uniref:3-hydroxybutyrate oligomer hydrolase family protein n=1 Tax=Oryzobacter terrae TaxID=1620385 RepID=UPI0036712C1C